jgi:hypothetical protein
VQKGIDKTDQSVVAIKIIPVENDISELMKEIDILQECQCAEIVAYKGAYQKDEDLWVCSTMHRQHALPVCVCLSVLCPGSFLFALSLYFMRVRANHI